MSGDLSVYQSISWFSLVFPQLSENISAADSENENHDHIGDTVFQVSLLGARLQVFPDAPFGANNFALFEY